MKQLKAMLCLTFALLLGSVEGSFALSIDLELTGTYSDNCLCTYTNAKERMDAKLQRVVLEERAPSDMSLGSNCGPGILGS